MSADMLKLESLVGGELPDARVGIGCGSDSRVVRRSARSMPCGDIVIYKDPKALADDLESGELDAAVRGSMSSSVLLPEIKRALGLDCLERLVIMGPRDSDSAFGMVPVGVDEGWTVDSRYDMTVRSVDFMKRMGGTGRTAVMSGGRKEDMGRCPQVDRTLMEAQELTDRLLADGYDVYNAGIVIEEAIKGVDLVVAPDGITGNMIFRSLFFIGGARAFGAPVLNTDKVFLDTSRGAKDFRDMMALAMKLTKVEM